MAGGGMCPPDGSWRDPGFPQTDDHPVTCIRLADARAYAAWLTRITGSTYRLPTEAEWDRAARASRVGCSQTRTGVRGTCPVGSYGQNFARVADMLGNVWEWTDEGTLRGGGWDTPRADLHVGARADPEHVFRFTVGFRIVREPPEHIQRQLDRGERR